MKNLTLKIACVLVSILVWIQVASTNMVESDVNLPMEIVGLDDEWTVAGSALPEEARARLRVTKLSLLAYQYLGWPLGTVQVDLTNFEPGPPELYVLKESDVRTEAEVVTLLPPIRLPLRIDWRDRRRLPVRVALRGQLVNDRMLAGAITVEPDSVDVTGPRRYFRGVDSLLTRPLDLAGLQTTERRDLELLPLPEPLELAQRSVRVTVPVATVDERIIANVPVLAVRDGGTADAGISPPVCDVLVRGPADSVASLQPGRLAVSVALGGLASGVHRVTGEVEHPDWVIAVRLEPETFMVILGEDEASEERR